MTTTLFKPGALVFDIGAHYGESANNFRAWGAGRVIAVEPNPKSFERLKHDAANDAITCLNMACDHEARIVELFNNERNDGCATTLPSVWGEVYPNDTFARVGYVPALTIGHMVNRFGIPDYVKVDVEGAEFRVLSGMRVHCNCLTFEFHKHPLTSHQSTAECLMLLHRRGYTKGVITNDDFQHADPTTPLDMMIQRAIEGSLPVWGNITVR